MLPPPSNTRHKGTAQDHSLKVMNKSPAWYQPQPLPSVLDTGHVRIDGI